MEQALSGQTVRFMFEDSPIGMCSVAADGTVLRRNPACDRFFTTPSQSIFEILHHDGRAELHDRMRAVLAGETRAFRASLDAADGRRIEVSGIPMRGGTGDLMLHLVDVSDHFARESDLRELAEHDALTGLKNRLSFNRGFAARLAHRPVGTLMMIDLDGFKRVNDTRGHVAGDAVLVVVAQALRGAIGEDQLVARIGGDEFAVLLDTETLRSASTASMLIRRISIAAGLAARGIPVSASIGMVELAPGVTPEVLFEAADRAMYAAKRSGKGRSVVANLPTAASQAS